MKQKTYLKTNKGDPSKTDTKDLGPVPLDDDHIRFGMAGIQDTVDGLSVAVQKFICTEKMLCNIDRLANFAFLRHVNVSFNLLTSLEPLAKLRHLLVIKAAMNQLTEFPKGEWPTLCELDLSHNQIVKLHKVKLPKLQVLNLMQNYIQHLTNPKTGEPYFTSDNMPNLHTLILSHNRIELDQDEEINESPNTSLQINLNQLKALFISYNNLISLGIYKHLTKVKFDESASQEGLEAGDIRTEQDDDEEEEAQVAVESLSALGKLPQLSVLHLRACNLRNLDGLTIEAFPRLQYLNLRENMISSFNEVKKLNQHTRLQTIILLDNPICEIKDYRLEMRLAILTLRRLDKDVYTEDENMEADEMALMRKETY